MNFASNQFFNHLKTEVLKDDGDGSIYYDLNEVLKSSIYGHIRNKVPDGYEEDVYQEVFLSVWRELYKYVMNSEYNSEAQRMSWLLTIVDRRIADFYKWYYRVVPKEVPLDDSQTSDEEKSDDDVKEFTKRMDEVLRELFAIATTPEKIMGYVYSKIILSADDKMSGKPAVTAEHLAGKILYDILDDMKRDLKEMLAVNIPDDVYSNLRKKLDVRNDDGDMVGDTRFSLSVKKITDGTNRIQKKMDAFNKNQGKGGDDDDNDTFGPK